MTFDAAYRTVRNDLRKFRPSSFIRYAIDFLNEPVPDRLADVKRAPWHVLLLVKWALLDKDNNPRISRDAQPSDFERILQRIFDIPARLGPLRHPGRSGQLFFRQLLRPQMAFQRRPSFGFAREAALIESLQSSHRVRALFERRAGMDVCDFLDHVNAVCSFAIAEGTHRLRTTWFKRLEGEYGRSATEAFVRCVSADYDELSDFLRAMPNASRRVASEYYEFPAVARFPFFRTGQVLESFHSRVLYRGVEHLVHNLLSEAGSAYIEHFGKVFEHHVLGELRALPMLVLDEDELKELLPLESSVPDALLALTTCNVFVEAKAGLFDETDLTTGTTEVFGHKTRSIRQAINQAWSACVGLRREGRAPQAVREAPVDYLIVVTNKELDASNGIHLEQMYPLGRLSPPADAQVHLPLERIYVLSIEDFERLVAGARHQLLNLSEFLADCVAVDSVPETSVFYFEQHLTRRGLPMNVSTKVTEALDRSSERLAKVLPP